MTSASAGDMPAQDIGSPDRLGTARVGRSRLRSSVSILLGLVAAGTPAGADPSYDCNEARGTVEALICADEELAALDRELADVWKRALPALPPSEIPTIRAVQRGWIKGRNDCWKSEDVAACVRSEYERSIAELQIQAGLVMAPDAVRLACESVGSVWLALYTDTKVPVAVITSGDEQVFAFEATATNGRRFVGRNVVYNEHEGEVVLDWKGASTTCRPVPRSRIPESVCVVAPADASFVIATSPSPGAAVTVPFEVVGCSRTFESNVTWRLRARDGSVVAEGHTTGGGMSGPAPFRFTVNVERGAVGLHHLEVDEPRVTDEGFPPGRTVLPLVLQPAADP